MIVVSKRCFLNILTQLWDAEKLLNANYYIADCHSPNGGTNLTDNIRIDSYGQLVEDHSITSVPIAAIGKYNIKYSGGNGGLNPEPFRAECLMGIQDDYSSSYEKFIKNLNSPDTMLEVYNFLFKDPLKGNGIQVLIFYDDPNLLNYGNIVCQYLSHNFGVDIIFIDPQYRPNCRGYVQYAGNKPNGEKTIKDLRDYGLLLNFSQAATASGLYNSVSNLTVFLSEFTFEQIIYLYNLLFPDDPLPPGNYATDHIKQIIIGRATEGMNKQPYLNNLFSHDWRSVIERYDRESEEEGSDDTGLY